MPSRVFIKANLFFKVDPFALEFANRAISTYGVHGLPWAPLSPDQHFGRKVMVEIRIEVPMSLTIQTEATILYEQSTHGELMGLRFHLDEESRTLLSELIAEHGHYPTQYIRKYPRIPLSESVRTFPLRVIGTLIPDEAQLDPPPIIFDVRDLSPTGILLTTENPFALSLRPGSRLDLTLEPRGDFLIRVRVQGTICRAMDEKDIKSGNLIRFFGIRFTRLDAENRAAFSELLKDILIQIKNQF